MGPESRNVRIRIATQADAGLLADLGARTFVQAFGDDNNPEDLAAYLEATFGPSIQRAELDDSASILLIAQVADKPGGYAKLRIAGAPAPDCVSGNRPAELVRIYVEQRWTGQGLGSALMEACLTLSGERGCDAVWLSVWERNLRGIAFYKKWGFSAVGRQIFMVGSDAQQDLVMRRALP